MNIAEVFLILAVTVLSSAQSPEEIEYQRQLKEYEEKKKVYDQYQSIANVPAVASNDLIPKVPVERIPPGYAELLLPTYTGIPVNFHALGGPIVTGSVAITSSLPPPPPPPSSPVPVLTPLSAAVSTTALRAGQQSFVQNTRLNANNVNKRPAPSNVSFRSAAAPPRFQVQRPKRPNNLLLFTTANLALPTVAQAFAPAAPVPARIKVQGYRNTQGR